MRSPKYYLLPNGIPSFAALLIFGFGITVFSQDQGTPPGFTAQPTNQTVFADDIVTMTAAASGSPPLYYQWFFDGAAIGNATNASLTLTNVQGTNAGSYAVMVTNSYGAITSAAAELQIREVPAFAFVNRTVGKGIDQGNSIAVDDAGNIYVAGTYTNAIVVGSTNLQGAGGNEAFLVKYRHNGQFAWAKRFGGKGDDAGSAVAVDPFGFIYFSGSVTGLVSFDGIPWTNTTDRVGVMAKYTSEGTLLWVRTNPPALRLAFDRGGNIYAPAQTPAIFHKYDTNGARIFSHWASYSNTLPGQTFTFTNRAIAVDKDTNVFVATTYPTTIYFTNYAQTNIWLDSIWNFRSPMALVKFNPAGQAVWARRFGECYECTPQNASAIAMDGQGNAYVAGSLSGHGFVLQFDSGGASSNTNLFIRGYFSYNTLGTSVEDIAIFQGTNFYVAGSYAIWLVPPFPNEPIQFHSAGAQDGFIARLDSRGNVLEAKRLGGPTNDTVLAMALDPAGNPCVTGYFQATASFGITNLTSVGVQAVFTGRLQMSVPWLKPSLVNNSLRLSWNRFADGLALESSDSVTGPYSSGQIGGPTGTIGNEAYMDLPVEASTQKFFRLRRP